MWHPDGPAAQLRPDTRQFIELVNAHAAYFLPAQPLVVTRAPGRLDLMGGIADYSGSLVLELPLAAATHVAAQPDPTPALTAQSLSLDVPGASPCVTIDLDVLLAAARSSYEHARQLLSADPTRSWLAYVAGALVVLHQECGLRPVTGARLLIHSNVPAGKGVSSSAALEVASLYALATLYGLQLEGPQLAMLCQKVENLVVGAPCGLMDQMTSALGHEGQLLSLRCQPAELEDPVPLPAGLEVWGLDSGIRHAVSGADYGSVRVAAFMGYRIIAAHVGLDIRPLGPGRVAIEDPRWRGYLANITPDDWEDRYRLHVPAQLDGATFLRHFGGSTDPVTRIDPAQTYPVRAATAHPIYEHQRVLHFRHLLTVGGLTEENLVLLGMLMYASHASYSACGLGASGTDMLVNMVRQHGPAAGLYGAKITGGGSGGTVAVLARRGSRALVEELASQYAEQTGRASLVLGGSSPGALPHGPIWLVHD